MPVLRLVNTIRSARWLMYFTFKLRRTCSMNVATRMMLLPLTFYSLFLPLQAAASSELCAGIVFRETPYADIRCARKLSEKEAAGIKHFQFEYDDQGRLTSLKYQLQGRVVDFADRFVRAPHIKIDYKNGKETRRFYDPLGARTLVSGDVYESHFDLDEKGRRTSLTFHDIEGKVINNDFGIARYQWQVSDDGQVTEQRFDTGGELVRNRPGFGFLVTKFAYDANGLLTRMYNLGADGEHLSTDQAGVAMTQIEYNQHGEFTRWLNLEHTGRAHKGMSEIAEIVYEPSGYGREQLALFIDDQGQPQSTRWGAHKVYYQFDKVGNPIERTHFGTDGKPVNSSSGIAKILSKWSKDGVFNVSDQYYDKEGNAVVSSYSGVHSVATLLDNQGRPVSRVFYNLDRKPVIHKGLGYAHEDFQYDSNGYLKSRRFLDTEGQLALHNIWQVAEFIYEYDSTGNMVSYVVKDDTGEITKPNWNPAH
ncbi:hypothetical protein P2G88_12325 [Aliiglaciecola sp. CAU 1673]|uniref:hypothetical protein n=1 Tax=Aliiglaciecola sp. CAU 1673 TaxID=3032595 RepID=UPI0023DB3535|nr:hypothetical protein [Aliiglaciecola sp. CAU 1673]MDF2179038.1 hypothetical protein [Aliiglaciecola sp. CAU 1673]